MSITIIDSRRNPDLTVKNKNIPFGTFFTGRTGDDSTDGLYLKIGDFKCAANSGPYPGRILRIDPKDPVSDMTIGSTWDSADCPVINYRDVRLEINIYEP